MSSTPGQLKTPREWEQQFVSLPPMAVGEAYDAFFSAGTHVRVLQTERYRQRWESVEMFASKLTQQIWDREWPLRPDPLRVAVQEAQERGRDFMLQSSLAETDLHGGEQ